MPTNTFHTTVLKQEAITALNIQKEHWYIDCTLGGAGHTSLILSQGAKVLGIDQDQDAINAATQNLSQFDPKNFILAKSNFNHIDELTKKYQIKPSGILFDLGVSNYQLSGNNRGFSFQNNEKLDMRMDPENQAVTAKDLVNGLYENELASLIAEYGEDRFAKLIAKRIVLARKTQPIETTNQLKEIIENVYQAKYSSQSRLNPATKTFQALRILVNDELNVLDNALEQSLKILTKNGRIAVISFHSLEDKIIKNKFKTWQDKNFGNIINKKPIIASNLELEANLQSRSAKLRVFEKTL